MRRTSGAETAMRMTSGGTDEIEIEIFRHSPRRDGTARTVTVPLCHFQLCQDARRVDRDVRIFGRNPYRGLCISR
jgi:hypothetical protein